MKTKQWIAAAAAGLALALAAAGSAAQEKQTAAPAKAAKAQSQRTFATPQDAVKALVEAARSQDAKGVLAVIGPEARSWLSSGDPVSDRAERKRFVEAYDQKNAITMEGDNKAWLAAGEGDWTFPAPLIRKGDQWSFDAQAGHQEFLNRRIGRNELDTIQTLLAIVDAQREYAATDADGNGLADYASRFNSTPGKKDGLYWPTKTGEPPSPLGPLAAKAVSEGYGGKAKAGKPRPYHGYIFHMLTAQGKDANGGAFDYLVHGKMFGGFAVLAYPASWGNSGIKTFVVSHDGVVFERDLGPQTAGQAAKIKLFNPGPGWTKSEIK